VRAIETYRERDGEKGLREIAREKERERERERENVIESETVAGRVTCKKWPINGSGIFRTSSQNLPSRQWGSCRVLQGVAGFCGPNSKPCQHMSWPGWLY